GADHSEQGEARKRAARLLHRRALRILCDERLHGVGHRGRLAFTQPEDAQERLGGEIEQSAAALGIVALEQGEQGLAFARLGWEGEPDIRVREPARTARVFRAVVDRSELQRAPRIAYRRVE